MSCNLPNHNVYTPVAACLRRPPAAAAAERSKDFMALQARPSAWTGDLARFDFDFAQLPSIELVVVPAYLLAGPLLRGPHFATCTTDGLAARMAPLKPAVVADKQAERQAWAEARGAEKARVKAEARAERVAKDPSKLPPAERQAWAEARGAEKARLKAEQRAERAASAPIASPVAPPQPPRAALPAGLEQGWKSQLAQTRAKVAIFGGLGADTAGTSVMSGLIAIGAEQALAGLLAGGTTAGPVVDALRAMRKRCEQVQAAWPGTRADAFGQALADMLDQLQGLRSKAGKTERAALDAMTQAIFTGTAKGLEFGKPTPEAAAVAPVAAPQPEEPASGPFTALTTAAGRVISNGVDRVANAAGALADGVSRGVLQGIVSLFKWW